MTAGVIRKCQAKTESSTLSPEFSAGNDLRMEWMSFASSCQDQFGTLAAPNQQGQDSVGTVYVLHGMRVQPFVAVEVGIIRVQV